ncbi:MAG TPA: WbqC family protein, partial [Bacteroidia bacterium]|nr:WbqC family protein [Bacteroidia bacterium]
SDAVVSDRYLDWREGHWKTLQMSYSKAAHFKTYFSEFENLYKNNKDIHLSKINYGFIALINSILDIRTPMVWSSEFELKGDKNEKLVNLCLETDTTDYYTGPSAKDYLDESLFDKAGIKVHYIDYSGYPAYTQLYGDFVHELSILDLIFNEGPNMRKFMKSFK